ncbi:flagellar basal body P-ring protein FlgI [Buchnera aphidicola (Mollitrichosiphum nigrofasciatum)]|uniref:flagellar basal body P-ring protein FlgI n=1 Tax=Buchnera aphidicola TaxID=9 RepID=UPI0031B8987C
MFKNLFLKFILLIYFNTIIPSANADIIKNITNVDNIQETHLIGYGLIVGLHETGDYNNQTNFSLKSLNNMLNKLNINTINDKNIQIKNIASVMVVAKLPQFYHIGDKIDVTVASIGNSTNINQGILLMTTLKDINNNIYAIAQGKISKNHIDQNIKNDIEENNGYIYQGGIITNKITNDFEKKNIINLKLNEPNYTLCQKVSDVINLHYPNTAFTINAGTIELHTSNNNALKVKLIANIENLDIPVDNEIAKITINAKTGLIVIKGNIKIDKCFIINKNIFLNINKENNIYFHNRKLKKDENNLFKNTHYNKNVEYFINKLYKSGLEISEIISILQTVQKSGCLHAKLEII